MIALSSPVCVRVRGIFEIAAYRQATPKNKEAPNNVCRELPDSIGTPLPLIADAVYGGILVFPEHWQTGPLGVFGRVTLLFRWMRQTARGMKSSTKLSQMVVIQYEFLSHVYSFFQNIRL